MNIRANNIRVEVERPPPQRLPHPAQALRSQLRRQNRLSRLDLDMDQVNQVEKIAVEPDELGAVVVLVDCMLRFGRVVDVVVERRRRELEEVGGGSARRVDSLRERCQKGGFGLMEEATHAPELQQSSGQVFRRLASRASSYQDGKLVSSIRLRRNLVYSRAAN